MSIFFNFMYACLKTKQNKTKIIMRTVKGHVVRKELFNCQRVPRSNAEYVLMLILPEEYEIDRSNVDCFSFKSDIFLNCDCLCMHV